MFRKIFKNPETRIRNLLLIILPFVILICTFVFFGYRSVVLMVSQSESGDENTYYIESKKYKLRNNATNYQIELFNELNAAIEDGTDDLKIAELVVKNYVADFYTWTNKSGSYDIGGIYFVYSPQRYSIILDARMHFYKYLTYYINTYGSENLLEVTCVNLISSHVCDSYFEVDGKSYPSYYVECDWTFNDFNFGPNNNIEDEKSFLTKGYFTVIKNDDGRFEIVEAYGDE